MTSLYGSMNWSVDKIKHLIAALVCETERYRFIDDHFFFPQLRWVCITVHQEDKPLYYLSWSHNNRRSPDMRPSCQLFALRGGVSVSTNQSLNINVPLLYSHGAAVLINSIPTAFTGLITFQQRKRCFLSQCHMNYSTEQCVLIQSSGPRQNRQMTWILIFLLVLCCQWVLQFSSQSDHPIIFLSYHQ